MYRGWTKVFIIVLAAALSGSVASAQNGFAPDRLPFRGRIAGSFTSVPTANPPVFTSSAQATGEATHLGAFTKVTSDIVNVATGEIAGAFTMTAASGEHLTGVYGGYFIPGATPGTFSWVLETTITGGTGRFANATGEFVFIADVHYVIVDGVVHGEYTETFDGTISY